MIDFILCPDYMRQLHCTSAGSQRWNMNSDHRAIHLAIPAVDNGRTNKRWKRPTKREVNDPGLFGEAVEKHIREKTPGDLKEMDELFAEIAAAMPTQLRGRNSQEIPGCKTSTSRECISPYR